MESVIQKSIDWCFSDEIMKAIASEILLKKSKSTEKVHSLQVQAIKSIMRLETETDVHQKLFFDLIFKEPINFRKFMDQYSQNDTIIESLSPITWELKSAPELFLLILEQNLCNNISYLIRILVRRDKLEIRLVSSHVITIPHGNDKEYDFDWADKFARMAFLKGIYMISLQIDGEGTMERQDMQNRLNDMVTRLDSTKPPEGWKNAIEKGNRTVWIRYVDSVVGYTTYVVHFGIQTTYHHSYDDHGFLCFE